MIYGLNKESSQILHDYHLEQEGARKYQQSKSPFDHQSQVDSYIDHFDRSDEKEKRSFLLSLWSTRN